MSLTKKIFGYLSFFIIFLALGFYGYHLYKYPSDKELSESLRHLRKHYPNELLMKIGGRLKIPKSRTNHFLKFSQKKEKGIIRIGTFGDSFTFGSEVHKEASYPSQLQTLLNSQFPLQKIEVLNFGRGGHGFQEQFFLWEKYAKLYEIDYILYGPYGFFPVRDLTFRKNWTYKIQDFFFPRDRFILSEETKLQLVSLKGSSPEEKYKNYYTLFPSLTALHYDKNPFQLWESYLPFLREKLINPLYYSDLPEHIESKKINQILLNKIKEAHNKKIFWLTSSGSFFENYQDIKNLFNLNLFDTFFYNRFLYKVFGHFSSLGNEIIAHIYLYALIGKTRLNFNALSCNFNSKKNISVNSTENIYLNNVRKIFTGTKNILLGEVRLNSSDHYWGGKGSFFQNKPKNIKSLIGFSDTLKNDYGLSPYFLVPFELSNQDTVFIKFSNGEQIPLGQIKELDIFGKFFNFYSDHLKTKSDKNNDYYEVYFFKEKFQQILKEKLERSSNKKIYFFINDHVLGELISETYKGKSVLVLKPYSKNSFLMMGPQHLVREKQLPSKFPLYIHYIMEDDRVLKSLIPDWSCYKEKQTYKLELPNFEPLKKIHSSATSHPL